MYFNYVNQATSLRHFSGHYRQKRKWIWALAAAIGRFAPTQARRFKLVDSSTMHNFFKHHYELATKQAFGH